jgi:threonine aldolase
MTIDLRSDTVTRPTPGMREAMMAAPLGDDVYGEDPTVLELEAKTARMFGMQAGLFCASGTMTNQIAIRVQTQPGDEVICDRLSHIYNFEGGGIAVNALASVRLLHGERGRFTPADVLENINPEDIHYPTTRLVALENTVNKGGGCYYRVPQIAAISEVCQQNGLLLHLDGARVFNALVETGEDPAQYGRYFDSISVCLSKGLGAPVGSVLVGSRDLIRKARKVRKLMGGGWRQAGLLAAAGIYALDHHVQRLKDDHRRAIELAGMVGKLPFVESTMPAETNIVIFRLDAATNMDAFIRELSEQGIRVSAFGKQQIRMVTHLDFTDAMLERMHEVLSVKTGSLH